jgi:hypothetical protein
MSFAHQPFKKSYIICASILFNNIILKIGVYSKVNIKCIHQLSNIVQIFSIHHIQQAPERQKLDYINKHWLKYTSGEINRFHFIKIMGYYNIPSIDLYIIYFNA